MTEPIVRPDVAAFLASVKAVGGPKPHEMGAPAARALIRSMNGIADLPTGSLAVLRDGRFRAPHGGDIAWRLFDGREAREAGPAVLFFHGGGWVLGDLDGYEPPCAEIARALDLPVIAIDYRLAPEHPWPAAPDDCEAAARWLAEAPEELGLKPTSLILAGDSAGGTLAIITAIALREQPAAVPVLAQWALYPAADLVNHYPSFAQFRRDYLLTDEVMRWFNDCYQPDVSDWRGSPMAAPLEGLPPALVCTAGADPIRDQGRAYASALANAGVPLVFREAEGQIHAYMNLRRAIPSAAEDFAADLAALRALIDGLEAHA